MENEESLSISTDEEDYVPSNKTVARTALSNNISKQNAKSGKNRNKPANMTTNNDINTYTELKDKIRECFGDGIVVPVMSLNMLYCERHTTMFDYKKGPCRKGKYHGHKTLTNFLTCCDDSFALLNYKTLFVMRRDKAATELTRKRLEMHYKNVKKNDELGLLHLEIMIINMFAMKTSVPIDDLEKVFYDVYKVEISEFCKKHSVLRTLQILNSPNMVVSISQKHNNVVCIPTFRKEFSDYKKRADEYAQVLNVEDNILRPQVVSCSPPSHQNKKKDGEYKSRGCELFKNEKLNNLLTLADINVPRSIQKRTTSIPRPSELYKELECDIGVDPAWSYILQALNMDGEEDAFIDINKG
ncbi:hypothetical protein THOM_2667 [Trachipleistophora hominis]|uniref:Uncharacterized protein n=1 Tax=Trachipleistophora hominis TaxID=72359 RepID=L7JSH0_TRAHO|nr:hypothetical protein THOM_2667 [Trachipleistophora hominis]